jgi:hypothetical protein
VLPILLWLLDGRYVSILTPYLERNLRINGGIVDQLLIVTLNRDHAEGTLGARRILDDLQTR